MIDWTKYHNFTKSEFDCPETGENEMKPAALDLFQAVRLIYAKPMVVTRGYVSPLNVREVAKENPGAHPQGLAGDFAVNNGGERHALVRAALKAGALGVGVGKGFVHIDAGHAHMTRPALWTY